MSGFSLSSPTAIDARTLTTVAGRPALSSASSAAGIGGLDLYSGLDRNDPDALLVKFQSVLFTEMLKAMRATIPESELFGSNTGRDMFQSFLDEQYVESLSLQMESSGLTDALRYQLGMGSASGSQVRENE